MTARRSAPLALNGSTGRLRAQQPAPTLFCTVGGAERRTAVLSEDELYRFRLTRIWDDALPLVAFIMLNPSTADALVDDPTIGRCRDFATRWGHGGIVVVNLFAWRATKPSELLGVRNPIGPGNDQHIIEACDGLAVIAAWGASVPQYWRHRPGAIIEHLRARRARLHHLGLTKHGHPRHPLYLRGDTTPTRW